MRLRLIAILCVLSSSMVISGCEINNGQEERVSITPAPVVDTKKRTIKTVTLVQSLDQKLSQAILLQSRLLHGMLISVVDSDWYLAKMFLQAKTSLNAFLSSCA